MKSTRFLVTALIGLLTGVGLAQDSSPKPEPTADWTELGGTWTTQSYWQVPDIQQEYLFTPNGTDKVVGQTSVDVQMRVAAKRPQDLIELRYQFAKPMDLSKVKQIELWLKHAGGSELKPRDVYFCDPRFDKIAVAQWDDSLDLRAAGPWQRVVLDLEDCRIIDKLAPPGKAGEYDRHDIVTICLNFTFPPGPVDARLLIDGLRPPTPGAPAGDGKSAEPTTFIETTANGFLCKTKQYELRLDPAGNLQSLKSGGCDFLQQGAGFVQGNQFVAMKTARLKGSNRIVTEGELKDAAKSLPGSPCPFTARVTYRFKEDRIELTLEQSFAQYGGFGWTPSASVLASRDALVDNAMKPGTPALYGQTDPRWITSEGPVLRFDFGVWQKGFANTNWQTVTVGGKAVPCMASTVPGTQTIKAVIFPLAQPSPKDALTFDISAASPDFLLPGGQPVHFDIKAVNAGPSALETTVRFEVRDYLTEKPVGTKVTAVKLASKGELMLPTDLPLDQPGPYRGAIVIEEAGKVARSFWWLFTYDFEHYKPATTRPADFDQFWKEAKDESAALPLDAKMRSVPEKSTEQIEVFKVNFATLGGRRIYGWHTRPKAPGKYPAHIRFPSSGVYPLAGPEMLADRCTLWILITGFDVDLSNMPAGDDPGKNYWTAGIQDPKTSMWRTIYMSLVRAVDFMVAQPAVDASRVVVTGGSQGGGLTLAAAALDQRVALCKPNHFGLPRLDWTVQYAPGYWPFGMTAKPANQSEEQFLKTLSYFDVANHTGNIRCPVVAEIGLMDTVTAAGNQICALAHVPRNQLYLVCSPWAMHGGGSRDGSLVEACYARFMKGGNPLP